MNQKGGVIFFKKRDLLDFLRIVMYWSVGVCGCDKRYVWIINRVGVSIVRIN